MSSNELKNILDDLSKGSFDSVAQATLFALRDSCTFPQVYQITVALYGVVDAVHLQQVKRGLITEPAQQALALRGLASFMPFWLGRSVYTARMVNTLSTRWPIIREWLLFFGSDYVYKESVEKNMRILAKRAIVDFLGICRDDTLGDMLPTIISSPGIVSLLFGMWDLETRDRLFSTCVQDDSVPGPPPMIRTSAILDSWMCTFSEKESWNWHEIMRPFNNDGARIAATALDHLEHDLAQHPIDYDLIIWDIHLLTSLSVNNSIRIPLLMQHSIQKAAGVITIMVSQRPPIKQRRLVAKAISYACWYIRAYVEETDGIPWICEVLEAGLLPSLLAVEPWLKQLKDDNNEDWEPLWLLLSNIFPKYAIFRSVLKVMGRSIKALNVSKPVDRLKTDSPLHKYWHTLEGFVMERLSLLETDDVDEAHVDSCQSSKCNRSGPAGTYKRCAGCLHVHYCSRECQIYDWKQGGHQTYCRGIQARRAKGIMSRISTRDLRFLDRVIASDLSYHNEQISRAAVKYAPEPAVVEIDYTCIPFRIGVGSTASLPVPDTCKCDKLMQQKWDTMVELALNSKTPGQKLLIRAFIPCGSAPKVKLQLIPIKRILPGYDPSQDQDPAEAGDTFDHLYSCAGISFTIIDQSYPVETLKLMSKEMDMLAIGGKEDTTDPGQSA
ncbi:uncharacterized protein EDB91DRAFT_127513 [Suillus paluster]|uniref:uncharacterized protein n=1 Tax=Suillus paluster TaxID=48578 RepID=UPI001B883716|nr:uncharacterized protein EDB91DRAFT_127513 [Suillus paluster]KAG1745860.1 hypothetical protein EDB91DRAFT_127513 [Suillus paluster]